MKRGILVSIAILALSTVAALPAQARTSAVPGAAHGKSADPATAATPAAAARMMAAQEQLMRVSSPVQAYARSHPESGYAGVSIDPAANMVDLYWNGPLPTSVAAVVKRSAVRGTRTRVHSAPHSLRQLLAAQKSVVSTLTSRGLAFASVGPKVDGTGLTVAMPARSLTAMSSAALTGSSGVPVTVTEGSPSTLADRFEDTEPFFGGDYMQAAVDAGPSCSTGFAVQNSTAERFLLTASHCSPSGTGTWFTGEGPFQETIGSVAGWDGSNDAMIIATSSTGSVWTGASLEDPPNQGVLAVNGAGDPTVGELDCTDGAWSGEECGVQVVATNLIIESCEDPVNMVGCSTYSDMVQAEQQDRISAGGNGDSGGPVFTVINNGANARGTLTAVDVFDAMAPCNGVPTEDGRHCSWRVFFPDVLGELNDFGLTILANG